ncbi:MULTISPECIES: hypothetical protein [Gluconobacter]|uniref:Uncharacterized protein n=1 Tax=Gluconobacter cerinus TaxID=38307 RepID=A0A1B6VMZ0_9PROT|nr:MULTISPECIES: hypothetical protein [Gluconobacter]MBS0993657.1 hypothetical protein [Gluconobacter cerinus]MBS1021105.1 hypothetical protein [Gluconobacter cerinus]MBS1029914.1 hypothetical protein [Gluconobacter cerinus]MBS1069231.1 hypothetical protein [Gluconobacter cerinus]MBS1070552.1 hypothetical protein [Gluconobacter cerinus]
MAQATPLYDLSPVSMGGNVVTLRQGVLPRHREYLSRWLEAGMRMGLFDAEITPTDSGVTNFDGTTPIEHVLVWVRENPDPAYMLRPQGMRWILIDHLRNHELGSYASFELALHTIRPVLPLAETYAA